MPTPIDDELGRMLGAVSPGTQKPRPKPSARDELSAMLGQYGTKDDALARSTVTANDAAGPALETLEAARLGAPKVRESVGRSDKAGRAANQAQLQQLKTTLSQIKGGARQSLRESHALGGLPTDEYVVRTALEKGKALASSQYVKPGLDRVVQGGSAALTALDTPAHLIRMLGTGKKWSEATPEAWTETVRGAKNPLARHLAGAADVVGAPFGAATAALGGAWDLAHGRRPDLENLKQTFREGTRSAGDMAIHAITDPTSYVTGGFGEAANAAAKASRAAKAAKVSAPGLGTQIEGIVARGGAPKTVYADVVRAMRSAGVPDPHISSAFGAQGQHLGAGQLRVALPGTTGIEIGPALFGKENVARRAFEAAEKPVGGALSRFTGKPYRPLLDPARGELNTAKRSARSAAAETRRRVLEDAAKIADDPAVVDKLAAFNAAHPLPAGQVPTKSFHRHAPELAAEAGRKRGGNLLQNWLEQTHGQALPGPGTVKGRGNVHVPGDFAESVGNTFKSTTSDWVRGLERAGGAGAKAAAVVARGLGRAQDAWKGNVLMKNPAYHARNIMGDSLAMASAGENPAKVVKVGHAIATNKPGAVTTPRGLIPYAEVRRMAEQLSPAGLSARLELGQGSRAVTDLKRRVARNAPAGPLEKVRRGAADVGRKVVDAPEAFGQGWDKRSRLGLFAERLRAGDSPQKAMQGVVDVLHDYGDRPQWMQALSAVAPFSQYALKAPVSMAKAVAKVGPRNILNIERVARAATTKEGHEPREYAVERGTSGFLKPGAKKAWNELAGHMGGRQIQEGEDALVPFKTPFPEAMSFIDHPGATILGQLGPLPQMAIEAGLPALKGESPKSMVTDQPIEFGPLGAPGHYLSQFFLSDPAIAALNAATGNSGIFGNSANPSLTPEERAAQDRLRLLLPMMPKPVQPSDAIYNALNSPEVTSAKNKIMHMKQRAKRAKFRE